MNVIHFRWPKSVHFRLLPKETFGATENILNYHPLHHNITNDMSRLCGKQ